MAAHSKSRSSLWHKVTHWEYWSFSVLYFPINFYYAWLALRNRSFFFFTASNPTIEFGGMMGERKSAIYQLIPEKYLPQTFSIVEGDKSNAARAAQTLGFPLICKPDIGERGRLVEKIHNIFELDRYVEKCPVPFLMQEMVGYPVELGVFFIKHPDEPKGRITSIVQKDFLHVIGDGVRSVRDLLDELPRAQILINFEHLRFQGLLDKVPDNGEKVVVENIGNHCRGTTFLNAKHKITPKLNHAFNQLVNDIPGLHFGRFDLRCASFESLENLEDFKILELNGAGAEPAHIYHPGSSLFSAYKDICWHLNQLAQISSTNRKLGHQYWSFTQGWQKLQETKAYNKQIMKAL